MVAMAVLLTVGATQTAAFKAFNCNNGSAPLWNEHKNSLTLGQYLWDKKCGPL
jgi:hypothetical protein